MSSFFDVSVTPAAAPDTFIVRELFAGDLPTRQFFVRVVKVLKSGARRYEIRHRWEFRALDARASSRGALFDLVAAAVDAHIDGAQTGAK